MNNVDYKYQLDKSSKKFICPSCGKKRFVRYVNSDNEYLESDTGRCDREVSCTYHKSPEIVNRTNRTFILSTSSTKRYEKVRFLPEAILQASLKKYDQNNFAIYLNSLFGPEITRDLIKRFYIGTSKRWGKLSTIFWQIDKQGRIRQAKVMLYDPETGRRKKDKGAYFAGKSLLNDPDATLKQCLYGLHQLRTKGNKTIAIVESEKTAILSTVYLAQYTWMATGGKNGARLNDQKVLEGKRIILFPDLGCYRDWERKAYDLKRMGCRVNISNYLEQVSTPEEKQKGYDLADYLVKRDDKYGWALTQNNYPLLWDNL